MAVESISAESTDLFVGPADAPFQIVRVSYTGALEGTPVSVAGEGLSAIGTPVTATGDGILEVPVQVNDRDPGRQRAASVAVGDTAIDFTFADAEPGWTMFMISHFHYDPVWWNTQAAYTSEWTEEPPGRARQTNGFALVHAHLEMARRDADYKFVLAEVDYLKPYWDSYPEDRDDLRRLIEQGRVEIMGGTYNEPNTNLTSPETTIRNFIHGTGFQRDVMGADPTTAWQLDVFGHDPQFPGMAAGAGLTSSSWARGPHHQWGPMVETDGVAGDPERMQFASEFEWISPSGVGLLTHYMPAHYSAGWWMDSAATLAEAESATFGLFEGLKRVTSTRNVLLPVGTDYTPPNKWVTEIHRDWNRRYTWPRFVCALPKEFFAAVRSELDERGVLASPQTRDMNPIYTGKDVSFIDTKQANRAAEAAVLDAERFAVFAHLLARVDYPESAFAKAWVQLAYGAHHDGITGSESDQVYLDLLTGWRDAWELGSVARDNALAVLSHTLGGAPLMVWNPLAHIRTDIVTCHLEDPVEPATRLLDEHGDDIAFAVADGGRSLTWLARDVPSLGFRAYRLATGGAEGSATPAAAATWQPIAGTEIGNARMRIRVDPARGGGVESWTDNGRELIAAGRVGNELAVYEEHSAHPKAGEGPWHLLPKGPLVVSSDSAAEVQAYRCAVGERVVVRGRIGEILRYTQTLSLLHGIGRLDCRTTIDEFTGADQLLRLRWPTPVSGATAVSEVGDAVVGRGFGLLHEPGSALSVDTAVHPWTLENPAFGWFGLSSAARILLGGSDIQADVHAVSVAEVVTPAESESSPLARDLLVALVRAGVTATCSGADRPRYGHLDVDSNLPDTRIALGGPERNAFTAAVLADADPAYAEELRRQLDAGGTARVFVPAGTPLASEWLPDADLRGVRALPVLIIAGVDDDRLRTAITSATEDLDDAEIVVPQRVDANIGPFEDRTVVLLNRGVPSFAVDIDGTLHTSLMRSCTGWPSGVWTTHERRGTPDGSNFQLQHWTHTFDYAVIAEAGDWRQARIPARSAEFSRPLLLVQGEGRKRLPAADSLLQIDSDGVNLDALKMTGNPTPTGSARGVSGKVATMRLVETHGASAHVVVDSGIGEVNLIAKVDLLEDNPRSTDPVAVRTLHGYEIATVRAEFAIKPRADRRGFELAPNAEAAQPLYARYWLHNRGPAPLGGLPAVAHLHPQHLVIDEPSPVVLRLTAASDCTDEPVAGSVELLCPPGWVATPAALPFELDPGAHTEADLTVVPPPDAAPGWYPVRAQLTLDSDVPAAWRQTVEDICLVSIGEPSGAILRLVGLIDGAANLESADEIVLSAGEVGRLTVTVATDAHADLAVEAHLISPWGTWEWIGPAAVGAVLPASGQVEIGFDVTPPPWLEPGEWWALVRVACAGQLVYSPAVRIAVR